MAGPLVGLVMWLELRRRFQGTLAGICGLTRPLGRLGVSVRLGPLYPRLQFGHLVRILRAFLPGFVTWMA